MGETRVDLLHLLEDLADAYPGDLEETILTEIVANALDSRATNVRLSADPASSTLTVVDDGVGMRRAELRRFHDIAATAKARGEGIGFAGVGIKLGLLVSEQVITESRRGKDHASTTWALAGRNRAPWQWNPPIGLVVEHGTAVRLTFTNALSPLLDPGFLEATLRRHFDPLFDTFFDEILRDHYPERQRFFINGRELPKHASEDAETATIAVRLARKRKPSALGYLRRAREPWPEEQRGIAISTFGKVIKRGWEWLGVTPVAADRVSGMIEAPALAACLTLNKADFLRSGPRGATYFAYRKALQQAVSEQLAAWGDARDAEDDQRRRVARPVERDLERVLFDLADRFPLLAMLVERRPGGRRRMPVGRSDGASAVEAPMELFGSNADVVPPPVENEPQEKTESEAPAEPSTPGEAIPEPAAGLPPALLEAPDRKGSRRPVRLGLMIQFESRPEDPELGRLVETTVFVNAAHPAYRRAVASRSEGYHVALSVAMALAGLAVDPSQGRGFVTEFLARWGEALDDHKRGRSRGSRKRG